jgi:tRNA(fMet)-specific endonuclease VapC
MRFLLDTNTIAALVSERPNRRVMTRAGMHQGHIAIGAPSWHEIVFGLERMPSRARAEQIRRAVDVLRDELPVVEYDAEAAEWHARERARLLGMGRTCQILDGQIAAIAATRRLTLVTANTKDFRHYTGITIVDWTR